MFQHANEFAKQCLNRSCPTAHDTRRQSMRALSADLDGRTRNNADSAFAAFIETLLPVKARTDDAKTAMPGSTIAATMLVQVRSADFPKPLHWRACCAQEPASAKAQSPTMRYRTVRSRSMPLHYKTALAMVLQKRIRTAQNLVGAASTDKPVAQADRRRKVHRRYIDAVRHQPQAAACKLTKIR